MAVCVAEFDRSNPEAVKWARRRAAALVAGIPTETRIAVRMAIAQGISHGITPGATALLVRGLVGLTRQQAASVVDLHSRLSSASPGSWVRVGTRAVRVPKRGMAPAEIAAAADRYAARLRRRRAMTIARTETVNAANQGQLMLWRQARRKGQIPKNAKRRWIATMDSRTRDKHRALHGVTVELDESFPGGIEPGQEPNCRCTQGLVA